MWESENRIEIAAPPEEVYRYLADFGRHREWSLSLAELEQVGGNGTAVGTEFKAVETVPGKFTSFSRITALEPPRRIAWDARAEGVMAVQWTFELSPHDDGTLLVQRSRWQPRSVVGWLMLNLMRRRQVSKENQQSLERIKSNLERRD